MTHPQSFPGLSDELRSIVESFTRPEQDLRLPAGVHIESAGVQTGRAAPYTIEAPNERWHVTDATHQTLTGSDIDLSLVRPERAAYAIITSEPISAEKNVDDLTADLIGAFKRAVPAVEIGVVAPSGPRSRSFHLVLVHEGYPYECDIEVVIARTRAFVVRTGADGFLSRHERRARTTAAVLPAVSLGSCGRYISRHEKRRCKTTA